MPAQVDTEFSKILKTAFMYPYHSYRGTSHRWERAQGATRPRTTPFMMAFSQSDLEEIDGKIPYVSVGPWGSDEYLNVVFDASVHRSIPVLRAQMRSVENLWSVLLDPMANAAVPTLAYGPGRETAVFVIYLTTTELLHLIELEKEHVPSWSELGVINTPMYVDVNQHWPGLTIPRAVTHIRRPLKVRVEGSWTMVHPTHAASAPAFSGSRTLVSPHKELTQYQILSRVFDAEGATLNKLIATAAKSRLYRIAVMNRLSHVPIKMPDHMWTPLTGHNVTTFLSRFDFTAVVP